MPLLLSFSNTPVPFERFAPVSRRRSNTLIPFQGLLLFLTHSSPFAVFSNPQTLLLCAPGLKTLVPFERLGPVSLKLSSQFRAACSCFSNTLINSSGLLLFLHSNPFRAVCSSLLKYSRAVCSCCLNYSSPFRAACPCSSSSGMLLFLKYSNTLLTTFLPRIEALNVTLKPLQPGPVETKNH